MKPYSPPVRNVIPKRHKGRNDNVFIGLIVGLIFPLIGLVIVNVLIYNDFNLMLDILKGKYGWEAGAKPISLSMIINLIPFYLFLNKSKYANTKGIIIATGIYFIIFVLYKFIL